MINFKCKMCGGALSAEKGQQVVTCEFCGTTQPIPVFDDEKKEASYNKADIDAMREVMIGIGKIFAENKETENMPNDSSARINAIEEEYKNNVKELEELDKYCLSADDIQPIIAFFEKNIAYKDSEQWLNEAKYQYAKRVSNFYQCMQATEYLNDIAEDRNIDDLKDKVTEQAIDFRMKELQDERIAPLTDEIEDTYTLGCALRSIIDSCRAKQDKLSDFDKMIIRDCSDIAKDCIKNSIKNIVDKEIRESELKRLTDLIKHLKGDDNFSELFSVCDSSVKKRIAELEKEEKDRRRKKIIAITAIASSALIILIIIIRIAMAANAKKQAGYSAEKFTIKVVSKTNDKYNESLADGYVGSGYYYTFRFEVTNQSPYVSDKISGDMDVLNSEGEVLTTSGISLPGVLGSGVTKYWTVQLNVSKGNEAREIWNTPLDFLEITFKITSISFEDGTTKKYSDTKNVVVHSISENIDKSDVTESKYRYALSLFENKKYEDAMQIFLSLGDYKQAAEYAHTCDSKLFYLTMDERLADLAGADAVLPDNYEIFSYNINQITYFQGKEYRCFSANLVVNADDSGYLYKFREKLLSNGFVEINEFEYTKGYTVIQFSDIQEGFSDNTVYYYAFKLSD